MRLGIDVLAHLRESAHTTQTLAAQLGAGEPETQDVLDLLEGRGLVSAAAAGLTNAPDGSMLTYLITPDGEALYANVLDRFAGDFLGHRR